MSLCTTAELASRNSKEWPWCHPLDPLLPGRVANLGPAISICHSHQDEPNSTDAHAHRGRGEAAFLRPRPEEARLAHNGNGIHVIGRGCWVEHDKTAGMSWLAHDDNTRRLTVDQDASLDVAQHYRNTELKGKYYLGCTYSGGLGLSAYITSGPVNICEIRVLDSLF